MQNKHWHSDWQQESASKNLVGFVKDWLLGCQTVKWEIKKKKGITPSHTQNVQCFMFFKNKINNLLYTNNWRVIFLIEEFVFYRLLLRHSLVT